MTLGSRVESSASTPGDAQYSLTLEDDGQWLVYDVVIDGVSLVTNYRSSFARLIREGASREQDRAKRMQAGIDNLIQSLAAKNDEADKKPASGQQGSA